MELEEAIAILTEYKHWGHEWVLKLGHTSSAVSRDRTRALPEKEALFVADMYQLIHSPDCTSEEVHRRSTEHLKERDEEARIAQAKRGGLASIREIAEAHGYRPHTKKEEDEGFYEGAGPGG